MNEEQAAQMQADIRSVAENTDLSLAEVRNLIQLLQAEVDKPKVQQFYLDIYASPQPGEDIEVLAQRLAEQLAEDMAYMPEGAYGTE